MRFMNTEFGMTRRAAEHLYKHYSPVSGCVECINLYKSLENILKKSTSSMPFKTREKVGVSLLKARLEVTFIEAQINAENCGKEIQRLSENIPSTTKGFYAAILSAKLSIFSATQEKLLQSFKSLLGKIEKVK